MYFSPRKLLLSHNTTTATLFVKAVATCHCYLLCASDPNCTQIAQLDEVDRYPPPPPPPSATQKSNNMAMLLILMLSILGAAFLCLCYFTIMKRYRSNLTTSSSRRVFLSIFSDANGEGFSDDNHGHHPIWYIQTVGLQDSVIDSIPVFRYKKGDGLVEGSDCSVCLSEFEDDESLRLLPKCSHAFHLPCIDTWLRSHKNCPLCRAPIVRDEVSAAVDPTPESGDAMADDDDDEQVNHGNEGESPPSDEPGKIVGGRVFSDLGDHRVRTGDDRLQGVRRCLSMDLPSASRIYGVSGQVGKIQPIYEEGSSSGGDDDHQKKPNRRSSSRKSFSFLPIRMKRSFSSSSGKSSASRSQDLV